MKRRAAIAALIPFVLLSACGGHKDQKPDARPSGAATRDHQADVDAMRLGPKVDPERLEKSRMDVKAQQEKQRADLSSQASSIQDAIAKARQTGGMVVVHDGKPTIVNPPRH